MNSKINASTVGFAIGEAFGLPLNYERKEKLIALVKENVTRRLRRERQEIAATEISHRSLLRPSTHI